MDGTCIDRGKGTTLSCPLHSTELYGQSSQLSKALNDFYIQKEWCFKRLSFKLLGFNIYFSFIYFSHLSVSEPAILYVCILEKFATKYILIDDKKKCQRENDNTRM